MRFTYAVLITSFLLFCGEVTACVQINEFMPDPEDARNEWTELKSSCGVSVNLSGLMITDNVSPHYYMLSGVMEPGGFAVVANNLSLFNESCAPGNYTMVGLGGVSCWLNNGGDSIFLYNGSKVIDSVTYTDSEKNVSWSLCGGWAKTNATPGYPNECPGNPQIFADEWSFVPAAASCGDTINFSVTVNNTLDSEEEVSVNITIETLDAFSCGNSTVANNSLRNFTCSWLVPEMATEGTEEFTVFPVVSWNGSHGEGNEKTLTIEGLKDCGSASVVAEDVSGTVRFGDFAVVSAVFRTGNTDFPVRALAYVYSPKWITNDPEGNTIHSHLNESKAAFSLSMERCANMTLLLPLFLKHDCPGSYSEGNYTGRVRIYREGTDEIIAEDRFSIMMEGRNGIFCNDCPDCEDCECGSSSGTSSYSFTEKDMVPELLSANKTVDRGRPFTTEVLLRNRFSEVKEFSVYSYVFDGGRCVSEGLSGDSWKGGWTANEKKVSIEPDYSEVIALVNRVKENTEPGEYSLRVRTRWDEEKHDITQTIDVTNTSMHEKEGAENMTIQKNEENQPRDTHEDRPMVTGMVTAPEPSPLEMFFSAIADWFSSMFKF